MYCIREAIGITILLKKRKIPQGREITIWQVETVQAHVFSRHNIESRSKNTVRQEIGNTLI